MEGLVFLTGSQNVTCNFLNDFIAFIYNTVKFGPLTNDPIKQIKNFVTSNQKSNGLISPKQNYIGKYKEKIL